MTQSAITTCNAALNARNTLLNSGKVEIRTGDAADIDSAQTGSILETIILPSTVFPNASSRTSSANAIAAIVAASTATAGNKHYVAYNSSNGVERNGSAGTSGTDMILSSGTWNAGDAVSITSWSTAESK
jgi:hypothetical protein